MKKYKCIIIEDEPIAAEIISEYISEVNDLDLVKVFSNALTARDYLTEHVVDLIFLDLNLPKLKGLDFLNTLKEQPNVIITSAYDEYALKSYDYKVIDYLIKPIELSRFLVAINKFKDIYAPIKEPAKDKSDEEYIHININKKQIRLNTHEILFIESQREYLHIQLLDRKLICKMTISEIEQKLNESKFQRVHRSFIISTEKIASISLTQIEINGFSIPIGRNYREASKKLWN